MIKICTKCHKKLPVTFFFKDKNKPDGCYSSCKECYRKRIGSQKQKPRMITEQGTVFRRCSTCDEYKRLNQFYTNRGQKDGWHAHCKQCTKQHAQSDWSKIGKKKRNAEERKKVIYHYGGNPPKCKCCQESTYEFLCLDHVYNNGAEHRKQIGGITMYRWLIKNNFPKNGFQVLCNNCNIAKANYGICPHEENRSKKSS